MPYIFLSCTKNYFILASFKSSGFSFYKNFSLRDSTLWSDQWSLFVFLGFSRFSSDKNLFWLLIRLILTVPAWLPTQVSTPRFTLRTALIPYFMSLTFQLMLEEHQFERKHHHNFIDLHSIVQTNKYPSWNFKATFNDCVVLSRQLGPEQLSAAVSSAAASPQLCRDCWGEKMLGWAGHYHHSVQYQIIIMISNSPQQSSLVSVETHHHHQSIIRAFSDPNIFRNDRVLRTLVRMTSTSKNYFSFQTELKPVMRRQVAAWMLEVCEEEQTSPQVFCLAINYLDRFLSSCKIAK